MECIAFENSIAVMSLNETFSSFNVLPLYLDNYVTVMIAIPA